MCWSFFTHVQGVKRSSLTLKPVQKVSQHQQISCTCHDCCSIFGAKKFSLCLRQKQTVLASITLFIIMFNTTQLQNVSLFLQPVTYKYVFTEYVFFKCAEAVRYLGAVPTSTVRWHHKRAEHLPASLSSTPPHHHCIWRASAHGCWLTGRLSGNHRLQQSAGELYLSCTPASPRWNII